MQAPLPLLLRCAKFGAHAAAAKSFKVMELHLLVCSRRRASNGEHRELSAKGKMFLETPCQPVRCLPRPS